MSKEYLEALKNIKLGIRSGIFYSLNDRERFINDDNFKIIEKALQRLESIDNARPSEALKCLEELHFFVNRSRIDGEKYKQKLQEFNTIKQALIKAKEQEKV